jgi:cell division protein FtsA
MAKEIITAIDVGTTKIATIIAIPAEGGLQVLGYGVTHSKGLHKGLVVNITEAKESIKNSIQLAEQASGKKVESAYVGVTGRNINSINKKGTVSISRNDRLVRTDDLKRVLQSARTFTVPHDQKLLHVIPRQYSIDGQGGVKQPVGMHGSKLDVETHIITAAVSSIQNLVKSVKSAGINIDDLVLEPLASAEAVLRDDEKAKGIALADIGGGTTDIAIFKEGAIWHTAIIPVAGYQITRDIALDLGVPFDTAEQLKRKYGTVKPGEEGAADITVRLNTDEPGVSQQSLTETIKTRAEEIIKLIALELPTNADKEIPGGLVLTGGCANLTGLAPLAEEMLGIPVRIGIPTGVFGVVDILPDPTYATGVGLLLWGSKQTGTTSPQNWQTRGIGDGLKRFVVRIKKLIGR